MKNTLNGIHRFGVIEENISEVRYTAIEMIQSATEIKELEKETQH
jgi:hypothetical protein